MLTTEEILKKVRELADQKQEDHHASVYGDHHSAFKGKGMSFREVREYAAGDDVRLSIEC